MSPKSHSLSAADTRKLLRDVVLTQMREEPLVTRRFKIVRAAAAVASPLASDDLLRRSNHSKLTVLVETIDNVIPRLLHEGLIGNPTRGNYVLTASGKREAGRGPARRGGKLASGPSRRRRTRPDSDHLSVGRPYSRSADTHVSRRRQVLVAAWDLSEQDAQTARHERAVADLATLVTNLGLTPLAPSAGDPCFDLAYHRGPALYVVEAKTLPQELAGQRQQIRLGLGQVLEYACVLGARREDVRPVLLLASKPLDAVRRLAQNTCRASAVRLWISPVTTLPR